MYATRDNIAGFCNDYLHVKDFEDYCHNGLQVQGSPIVTKIISGVSISEELIRSAISKKAEMVIVHHGIFRNDLGIPPRIEGYMANRIGLLLSNGISLCGYHMPLDKHPEIGNNISLCGLLGIKKTEPFSDVGYIGELEDGLPFKEFVEMAGARIGKVPYSIAAGKEISKMVAVISGSASDDFYLASKAGADTYFTGGINESDVRAIEETGMNFVNAGHYNTEKLGVMNLGELVAKEFNIEVEFVDVPCDI